ncbi:MAG: HAD family hydrolase [Candidatus Hodarchaeales archaeon]|jgi:putative hydrolase of the HAD superfamily
MLKVVSFDVVGTLLDSNFEDHFWNAMIPLLYAEKRGISFKEANEYIQREYDHIGNMDIRWYQPSFWFKCFDLDEDPLGVLRSHTNKVKFYPETLSVLKKLSQKYDLIVVSGTIREIIEIMIEKVRHYFKHIFSPISDRNEVKKTPQMYEMICKVLRTEPDTMAHVGDEWYSDFISPSQIGIKSFYLDRTGKKGGEFVIRDLNELKDRLIVFQSFKRRQRLD